MMGHTNKRTTTLIFLLLSLGALAAEAAATKNNGIEIYSSREAYHQQQKVEELEMETKWFLMVGFLMISVAFLGSAAKAELDQARKISKVNQRLVRAIYSKPHIKAELEEYLEGTTDMELGNVPPVADLLSFGGHVKEIRSEVGRRTAIKLLPYLGALVLSSVLLWVDAMPIWLYALLLVIMLVGQWALYKHTGVNKPMPRKCQCCDCGKTATDDPEDCSRKALLDEPTLHSAAALCQNCNDTGVCGPRCTGCDDSHSMLKTLTERPGCMMCSIYQHIFGSIGMYLRRWVRGHRTQNRTTRVELS